MKNSSLTIFLFTATLLAGPPAAAHGPSLPADPFSDVDYFVFPGLTLGAASSFDNKTSLHLGGEVSAGYTANHYFYGGFVEGIYDFGAERFRFAVGPEIGLGPVGIDGGLLIKLGDDRVHLGGCARLFVSLGWTFIYVRYGGLVDAPDFVEYGVGFKLPLRRTAIHHDAGKDTRWHVW